jgi:putative flippase GtrA
MSIDRGGAVALFQRFRRPVLFLLVGVLNTAVGYGLFAMIYLLTQSHRVAVVIATILGVLFNFCSTGWIVFDNRSGRALIPFVLGYAVTLGANFILLELLVRSSIDPLIAQAACLPVVVVLGYLINSRIVFNNKSA